MKHNNKAQTTSASNAQTSQTSAQPLHANRPLLIDADNLSLRFGNEMVIENVSLCIHQGESIGLIGSNGAGKTTLLRLLLGLTQPSTGQVSLHNHATIGYVPQRGEQYRGSVPVSVLEVVMLGARGSRTRALDALKQVHMEQAVHKRFTELSGGQQQRVCIAKALASEANILVLDEPTTGIDERSQAAFYDLLRGLQNQGVTILMVSHELEAIAKLASRLICLNRTVLYDGPPQGFDAEMYLPTTYKKHAAQPHHHYGAQHA